jgi:hypothetical protein
MGSHRTATLASIVAGRILLATVAAAAVVFGFVWVHQDTTGSVASQKSYACPMHPEVTASTAGTCPICRMALEPKRPQATDASPAAAASSLTLPTVSTELRAFDALSRAKRFETSLEMRAPAWMESPEVGVALFHRDQSQLIKPGETALFSPSTPASQDSPGVTVYAADQPPQRWDDATDLVRFRVDAGAGLTPNQTGWVKFATRLRQGLAIRASAVRESPDGPYVLVASNGRRTLSKRPVEIGSRLYDHAAVISGLSEGEYVVAKHTFALDVERRNGRAAP